MAAGTFHVFDNWIYECGEDGGAMASVTFIATLVSSGYTPSLSGDLSSTAIAQVISGVAGYSEQTLANVEWTAVGSNAYMFNCDDFAFTTSAVMTPKYCVIRRKSDDKAVCYCDLATSSAGGTDCTQANFTIDANGLFRVTGG